MTGYDSFFDLGVDQVLGCIEHLGFSPTGHCLALNSLENRVYRIGLDQEESNAKKTVVAKFYRPGRWSAEQIQEEHDFIFELRGEDIPVVVPIRDSNGISLHSVSLDPGQPDKKIFFSLWDTLNGRIVEEFQEGEFRSMGRLLARLHNVGGSRHSDSRITMDRKNYLEPSIRYIQEKGFLPSHLHSRYDVIVDRWTGEWETITSDMPHIRIHGDCHKGNILVQEGGFTFLDFDDFMTGVPVQDVWMLLPFGDSRAQREQEEFWEGYREFREFPSYWMQAVDPLRAVRYIYYAGWIARRWDDPAFPNAFPHFGSTAYWEKEISDLEQLYYNYLENHS